MLKCKCGKISKNTKRTRKNYTCEDCINKKRMPKLKCSIEDFISNGIDLEQAEIMSSYLKNDRSLFRISNIGSNVICNLQRSIKTIEDFEVYKNSVKILIKEQREKDLQNELKKIEILKKYKQNKVLTIYEWATLYERDLQDKGYTFGERLEIYEENPTKEKMSKLYENIYDHGINAAERILQIGERIRND